MGRWRRDSIWYRIFNGISMIYCFYIFKLFSGGVFALLLSIWIVLIVLVELKIRKDKKLPDQKTLDAARLALGIGLATAKATMGTSIVAGIGYSAMIDDLHYWRAGEYQMTESWFSADGLGIIVENSIVNGLGQTVRSQSSSYCLEE